MLLGKNDGSHHIYLLDTMNNVLGILILVLILTQVFSMAASGHDSARPGELDELRARLRDMISNASSFDANLTDASVGAIEKENVNRQKEAILKRNVVNAMLAAAPEKQKKLDLLSEDNAEKQSRINSLPSRADLEEQLARANKRLDDSVASRQTSLEELKKLKESAVSGGQPLNFGGRHANVREKPDSIIGLVCRNGKLGFVDQDTLGKSLQTAEEVYVADLKARGVRGSYDGLANYVNNQNVGDESFRIVLRALDDNTGFYFALVPTFSNKTWVSNLPDAELRLRSKLIGYDSKKTVVQFIVYADSFTNYLELVTFTKKLGFRTSWVPQAMDEQLQELIRPGHNNNDSNSGISVDSN